MDLLLTKGTFERCVFVAEVGTYLLSKMGVSERFLFSSRYILTIPIKLTKLIDCLGYFL